MTIAWAGTTTAGPDFSGLAEQLRAAVDEFSGQVIEAREAVELLRGVEALARMVGLAQMSAAQVAERSNVAGLGMSGTGAGNKSEYRSTADFLSKTLMIPFGDAKRRLEAAEQLLPRQSITGESLAPMYPTLAGAVRDGGISTNTAQLISRQLHGVASVAAQLPGGGARQLAAMEENLTRTALQSTPETVRKAAQKWVQAFDQDGMEPSEQTKRQHLGLVDLGRKFGLRHFELFTDDMQAEKLLAACLPAANPRTGPRTAAPPEPPEPDADAGGHTDAGGHADARASEASAGRAVGTAVDIAGNTIPAAFAAATPDGEPAEAPEDPRSRPEKLLDGLIMAIDAGLISGKLPRNGGHRPQVMVTIDYQTLLDQLDELDPGHLPTSETAIGGRIHPAHIRQAACGAEIIPVVMGGEGQVLEVGRGERLFTPEQLKILYARDRGCSFPGCTVHAFMTEAHHILPWSHGGPTDVDNGVLACSFHHHLAHAGDWTIVVAAGVPYWVPPPWVDPAQPRLRNTYFHPDVGTALAGL